MENMTTKTFSVNDFRAAVIANNLDIVKYAIEHQQFEINTALNYSKLNALTGSSTNLSDSGFFSLPIIKNIVDIIPGVYEENKDSLGYRAIHWAARLGHIEMLNYLCDHHADVNSENAIQNTPLHVALYYQQKETVKALIKRRPEIDKINKGAWFTGITENLAPLHYAVLYSDAETLKCLLEAGATANIRGSCAKDKAVTFQLTPLHFAASMGDFQKVSYLLSFNHEVNCVDSEGNTPLHYAVFASLTNPAAAQIVWLLLQEKANPDLVDKENNTPIECLIKTARAYGMDITQTHLQVAQYLLSYSKNTKRFKQCIYQIQDIDFSIALNCFLAPQVTQQQAQIHSSLSEMKETTQSVVTNVDTTFLADTTLISLAKTSSKPMKKAPPPPPPRKKPIARKKYRETSESINPSVGRIPPAASKPVGDLMAALKERLKVIRKDVAPPKGDTEEKWESDEDQPTVITHRM